MEGIVPAVVQHARTKDVLMVGFMNEESVYKTIKDKKVTFWSRSKNRLWRKGETSGNFLNFVNMTLDCDRDTLLVQAIPTGDTCHTGTVTCFGNPKKSLIFLDELYEIISERKKNINSKSYTSSLFVRGVDKIAQKVGEEAVEVIMVESMTGYGIKEVQFLDTVVVVEAKSLNSRFFEINVKLSKEVIYFEKEVRDLIKNYISREILRGSSDVPIKVNEKKILEAFDVLNRISKLCGNEERVELETAMPFILKFIEDDGIKFDLKWSDLHYLLVDVLEQLVLTRKKEGEGIKNELLMRVKEIEAHLFKIESFSELSIDHRKIKMRKDLSDLLLGVKSVPMDRLDLEILIMSKNLDISEECQRLRSHNNFFIELLNGNKSEGRKFNFLVQEQVREINTIASKSQNVEISKYSVLIKEELEKMREQIQNIV
ncbi:hypothetical protein CHS0354_000660 [Potamilus streckersoni]|uniref:phosphoribosyl-AMP cyclohydrolase n=1 Tax=Potamilus streckersoni TaxID=2493646 RepID=A0AAE0W9B3_9BIVA|nr:hypothetical protein CHS0354_000660 [Potamilus streckersoni]